MTKPQKNRAARRHERNVLFFLFLIVLFLASIAHSTFYIRQYALERRLAEFEERDIQQERNRLLRKQNELMNQLLIGVDKNKQNFAEEEKSFQ